MVWVVLLSSLQQETPEDPTLGRPHNSFVVSPLRNNFNESCQSFHMVILRNVILRIFGVSRCWCFFLSLQKCLHIIASRLFLRDTTGEEICTIQTDPKLTTSVLQKVGRSQPLLFDVLRERLDRMPSQSHQWGVHSLVLASDFFAMPIFFPLFFIFLKIWNCQLDKFNIILVNNLKSNLSIVSPRHDKVLFPEEIIFDNWLGIECICKAIFDECFSPKLGI